MPDISIRFGEYTPTSNPAPGRVLSNHTDRSGTTIHGRSAIGLGAVFAAAGVVVGVLALQGQLNASPGVPLLLGPLMGGLFALAGMSFIVHGIAGVRVQQRVRRLRETHEREPWVWDHPWNESGSHDEAGHRIARAIWATGLLGLFTVPFTWIGFFSPERPVLFTIVAAAMNMAAIGCACWVVYLIRRRAKYGTSTLRFRRFPFRIGDEVELHLARPASLNGVAAPEATLRCVQERYETRRSGRNTQQVVVAYDVWSATARAELKRGEYIWRFDVPDTVPGTALSERPPRYWEMELKIAMPGVDYAGTFLVPVYEDGRRR